MRRLLIVIVLAVPVFVALASWNGAVAMLFGIAVLAFVLSTLYWNSARRTPTAARSRSATPTTSRRGRS